MKAEAVSVIFFFEREVVQIWFVVLEIHGYRVSIISLPVLFNVNFKFVGASRVTWFQRKQGFIQTYS